MSIVMYLKINVILCKLYKFVSVDEEDYNTMMTSMENLNHTSQVSNTPCNKVNFLFVFYIEHWKMECQSSICNKKMSL